MRSRDSGSGRPALRAALEVFRGRLPPRYEEERWGREFEERVGEALTSASRILDAGSGRRPAIPVQDRPAECRYIGLDLSMSELEQAPEGSYDEMISGDITHRIGALEQSFDLIVCFQVLEHIKPLDDAMENLRSYLRPGGRLVTQLSGSFSIFGIANRALPNRLGIWILRKLLDRPPDTVFPAFYDHCWFTALERILGPWSKAQVIPVWHGATYFRFLRPLMACNVAYEEWARLAGHRNLASHYVIDASR